MDMCQHGSMRAGNAGIAEGLGLAVALSCNGRNLSNDLMRII